MALIVIPGKRHCGGAIIECAGAECPQRFVSFSFLALVRKQAGNVGWSRVPPWALGDLNDSPRRRIDACPDCTRKANEAIAARKLEKQAKRELRDQRKILGLLRSPRHGRAHARENTTETPAPAPAPAPSCDGEHATPACADPFCWCGPGTPETRAFPDEPTPTPPVPARERVRAESSEGDRGVPARKRVRAENAGGGRGVPARERVRAEHAGGGRGVLDVVERIMRAQIPMRPMNALEVVAAAVGELALPTQSKTPHTIVSRDLALDVKNGGEASRFVRTGPGRFIPRPPPASSDAEPEVPKGGGE